jgi:hypothetical protein
MHNIILSRKNIRGGTNMNKYLRKANKVFSVINIMVYPFIWYWTILTAKNEGTIPTYIIFIIGMLAYYFISEAVKALIQEGQMQAQEAQIWQMKQE